jgi:hypothetical protein
MSNNFNKMNTETETIIIKRKKGIVRKPTHNTKELDDAIDTLCNCWLSDEQSNIRENWDDCKTKEDFVDYVSCSCWYALIVVFHKGNMSLVNVDIDKMWEECKEELQIDEKAYMKKWFEDLEKEN